MKLYREAEQRIRLFVEDRSNVTFPASDRPPDQRVIIHFYILRAKKINYTRTLKTHVGII